MNLENASLSRIPIVYINSINSVIKQLLNTASGQINTLFNFPWS